MHIESLESRRLLAASITLAKGTLTLTGTNFSKAFDVTTESGKIRARIITAAGPRVVKKFAPKTVSRIAINAKGGQDHLAVDLPSLTGTVKFDGGTGKDEAVLTTNGKCTLVGGTGDDTLLRELFAL
jgi:hypothetical protein